MKDTLILTIEFHGRRSSGVLNAGFLMPLIPEL